MASQQGKYLGQLFGKLHRNHKTLEANDLPDLDDEMYNDAFNYKHLGNLAYIGNSCVHPLLRYTCSFHYRRCIVRGAGRQIGAKRHRILADCGRAAFDYNGYSFAGGLLAMYAWRS